jgi:hypothetical protein
MVGRPASAAASAGLTSRPTPPVRAGTEKPQSSSSAAWSAARRGVASLPRTLATNLRPPRSAAVTKPCLAADVKPFFAPRLPGYRASSGFLFWIW